MERFLNRTGFVSAYEATRLIGTGRRYVTGNGNWSKTNRIGKMIDFVIVSDPDSVNSARVDYSLFTDGGTRKWCDYVSPSGYCAGLRANDLHLYSDHWAVVATLLPVRWTWNSNLPTGLWTHQYIAKALRSF